MKIKLSVVLPCYNEAASLVPLIHRYENALEESGLSASQFELVLVDNGSSDKTAEIIRRQAKLKGKSYLKLVQVKFNQGYGYGLEQGLKEATGEFVAFSHADEQCSPDDVFRAWEIAKESPGVLIKGARSGRPLRDRLFTKGFEFLAKRILKVRVREINAQPKVFSHELLPYLGVGAPKDFSFDLFVLLRAMERGLRVQSIPVRFPPRAHGESRWSATLRSKIRHSLAMIAFMREYRTQPKVTEESLTPEVTRAPRRASRSR